MELRFDVVQTAKALGISYPTIYSRLKAYGLPSPMGGFPSEVQKAEMTRRCDLIREALLACRSKKPKDLEAA